MYDQKYNWDAIAAFIAALIGLLAIFISGYTAWNVRQQTRAQVWPYLQMGESDFLPSDFTKSGILASHGGSLQALNKGVGPAIVRSVEVLVDGKPQPDWDHVFTALGYHSAPPQQMSSFNGTVIAPEASLNFLIIFGYKNWERFKQKLIKEMAIRACYCSTLGECWTSTLSFQKRYRQGQPVGSCSGVPEAAQFEG